MSRRSFWHVCPTPCIPDYGIMTDLPSMHATVALLEDTRTVHFETGEPVLLRRGDTGTVVMLYDEGVCEVELCDRSGHTYALLPLAANRLLVLHDAPEHVGA